MYGICSKMIQCFRFGFEKMFQGAWEHKCITLMQLFKKGKSFPRLHGRYEISEKTLLLEELQTDTLVCSCPFLSYNSQIFQNTNNVFYCFRNSTMVEQDFVEQLETSAEQHLFIQASFGKKCQCKFISQVCFQICKMTIYGTYLKFQERATRGVQNMLYFAWWRLFTLLNRSKAPASLYNLA